jgi:type I restriction enzyme M protein
MFLERYWNLLEEGGRLLTVIDDSVLSGKKYNFVRDFIREKFVIRGIVSLHGDAFRRAGARAKTSVLYLTRRTNDSETQPSIFVYESLFIGRDDVVPRTPPSVAEKARQAAVDEIGEIRAAFDQYMQGKKGPWLVPPDRLGGRLDAKFLRPWSAGQLEPQWKAAGATAERLEELVEPVEEEIKLDPDTYYDFLRVTYEGYSERGERRLGREVGYNRLFTAKPDDIVVSNISAVYRAICVMPPGMEDVLLSSEFTVLRLKPGVKADPMYLWSVLRTAAVIAEWLSGASGVGRHRVDWELLRSQQVPLLPLPQQKKIGKYYRQALEFQAKIKEFRDSAGSELASLELEGEEARDRLARAKPPR